VKKAAFTQIRRGPKISGYSVRTDRWRYTTWNAGQNGEQLFDMREDPGELVNLAGDPKQAGVVKELKELLAEYASR